MGFITADEVKEKYNISATILKKIVEADIIKTDKQGRSKVYDEDDIQSYLQNMNVNETKAKEIVENYYKKHNNNNRRWFEKDKSILLELIKKGYSWEEIEIGIKYLEMQGIWQLSEIYSNIENALEEHKLWITINDKDSIPYLIKYFYAPIREYFVRANFYSQITKIRKLLNNYTREEIISAIDYMHEKKQYNFNFLDSYIPEALEYKNMDRTGIRYCMQKCTTDELQKLAEKYYKTHTYFNNKLTRLEYAYLVDLKLTPELYEIGVMEDKFYCDKEVTDYTRQQVEDYVDKAKEGFVYDF